MKLPLNWLKKYIDVNIPPDRLAEMLTMSGTAVERVEGKPSGAVLDIEVTTNRPDCLSVLGLAREIAALTGKKITTPRLSSPSRPSKDAGFHLEIRDKKACPCYTARLIKNTSIRPAPASATACLEGMGSRPINNVVDATNFVLFEMGQPLHAFDFDKIKGARIIVRRALKNEKFIGIDGIEYVLDEETLVIADAERAIAIAGVMGGRLTEVTSQTRNLLLESAYFDPVRVRRASKKYKLSTESSYRFERGVDLSSVEMASRRAKDLILEWGGGQEVSFSELNNVKKTKSKKIVLRLPRMRQVLGLDVKAARVSAILKNLGFETKMLSADKIAVTPLSQRRDVQQEADLFEEILRIEGFEKVPTAIPITRHAPDAPRDRAAVTVFGLKKFLMALGFHEIITYSLLSGKSISDSGFDASAAQKIVNAVSAEQEYFRPSLLPGLLQAVSFNVHRKASSLKLFEIGNRFAEGHEETVLAVAVYGMVEENWRRKTPASFYDLKGALENALGFLGSAEAQWKAHDARPVYDQCATLSVESQNEGVVGCVASEVLLRWDIPHEVFAAEIRLDGLLKRGPKPSAVKPVPKFPSVRRDIAFMIDEDVPVEALEGLMRRAAAPFLKETLLFDEYKGKNIAGGKRSLAFALAYQKDNGTFTEEEINQVQTRVGEALKKEYRVEFR